MNKLYTYVPLHMLFLLILGILAQYYLQIWHYGFLNLGLLVVGVLIVFFVLKDKKESNLLALLLFFTIGVSSVYLQNSKNYWNHYQLFAKGNYKTTLKISKVLKSDLYNEKYEANVIRINDQKTIGNILVNIAKDNLTEPLQLATIIYTTEKFKGIPPPQNPNQFNYKNYLARQDIDNQIFLKASQFLVAPQRTRSLHTISENIRNHIQTSLLKHNFKKEELAVISAFLLGERKDISKDLLTAYANAGAIHILAVSGLHVGILLLVLSFLLKPLEKIKKGKLLKAFCIVLLLWLFAFIAGLSASVVRAVTMFTFVALGQTYKRKSKVIFSLVASFLFLLICKPMFLFDVGFQLSYLAVFGIIWVQPKLYPVYKPKFYLDKKIWQLSTVSIAAQIGILPLSIYYFQQFPGLFIVSNLIIIPFLGAILMGGIAIIILAICNFLPPFLATIYSSIISSMNDFVCWISDQEEFVLKEISLSFLMMLAVYFFMFSGTFFLIKQKPKRLYYLLVSILLLQSIYYMETTENQQKEAFIVFHKNSNSLIGKRSGYKLSIQNKELFTEKELSTIKPYCIKNKVTLINANFKNNTRLKNNTILIIDSLGIYNIKRVKKPIVILQYSPKINLERLIKKLEPSVIVTDGSNYKSYVNLWKKTCLKNKISFYDTSEKGAFVLEN